MKCTPLNIFLDDYYTCKSPENGVLKTKQKINCKHWSIDETECKTICSLKVVNNPTAAICINCPKRECITADKPIVPKQISVNYYEPEPPAKEPGYLTKIKNYAKAETSQFFQGKVSEEVFNKRKELCMSCTHRVNINPDNESIGWCKGGCGCKIGNPRSALSEKLYMPTLSCPLKKFGPESGEGFNITDALDSVKGAATAISDTLKSDNEINK